MSPSAGRVRLTAAQNNLWVSSRKFEKKNAWSSWLPLRSWLAFMWDQVDQSHPPHHSNSTGPSGTMCPDTPQTPAQEKLEEHKKDVQAVLIHRGPRRSTIKPCNVLPDRFTEHCWLCLKNIVAVTYHSVADAACEPPADLTLGGTININTQPGDKVEKEWCELISGERDADIHMCITSWLHEVINITPITLCDIERDDTLQACLMMGGLKITLRRLDTSLRCLGRQFFTVAEALAHVLSADNDQRSHSVCVLPFAPVQTTQTRCFDPDLILIWIFCLPTLLSSENGLGLLISYYKTWKRI